MLLELILIMHINWIIFDAYILFMVVNEIKYRFATIRWKAPIIHVKLKRAGEFGSGEIEKIVHACYKLAGNKPFAILTEANAKLKITAEGKKSLRIIQNDPLILANAVLVKKATHMLWAILLIERYNPVFQVRVYRDRRKAIKWLKVKVEKKPGR